MADQSRVEDGNRTEKEEEEEDQEEERSENSQESSGEEDDEESSEQEVASDSDMEGGEDEQFENDSEMLDDGVQSSVGDNLLSSSKRPSETILADDESPEDQTEKEGAGTEICQIDSTTGKKKAKDGQDKGDKKAQTRKTGKKANGQD